MLTDWLKGFLKYTFLQFWHFLDENKANIYFNLIFVNPLVWSNLDFSMWKTENCTRIVSSTLKKKGWKSKTP